MGKEKARIAKGWKALGAALLSFALVFGLTPFGFGANDKGGGNEPAQPNVVEEDEGDVGFIEVSKTFSGIDLADLPAVESGNFAISVTNDATGRTETLGLDSYDYKSGSTYYWVLEDQEGTYTVTESGTDVAGYEFDSQKSTGTGSVEIGPADISAVAVRYNPNDIKKIDFENVIGGSFTSQGGYFVWTETMLSKSEKIAIVDAINEAGGKIGHITVAETTFFSGDMGADKQRIEFRGGVTITKRGEHQYTVEFDDTDQWQQLVRGSYVVKPDIADISLVNVYEPATTSVSVAKSWSDSDNQDGIRPEGVTVNLIADGNEDEPAGSIVLNSTNNWQHTFTDLARKSADGSEITYTVSEESVPGYTPTVTGSAASGFTITNSHTPAKVSIPVTKSWNDGDNQDGIRPASVTVNLLANGAQVDTCTLSSANNWTHTFADKPAKAAGDDITYTVSEESVPGYTPTVTGSAASGFTITNSHTPEKVSVSASKIWNDARNQDGKRPEFIKINLMIKATDGILSPVIVDGKAVAKIVTEDDNWSCTFANLDKYASGKEIAYVVTEDKVDDYTTAIENAVNDETKETVPNSFVVTNTHVPEKTSVPVSKTWVDNDDQFSLRPAAVVVKLLADNEETGKIVTLSEQNGWKDVFANLDKYSAGREVVYTVKEIDVDGYDSAIAGTASAGFAITNTLKTGDLTINKSLLAWNKSMGSATVLFKVVGTYNGVEIYNNVVGMNFTAAGSKTKTIKNLPVGAEFTIVEVDYSGNNYTADTEAQVVIIGDESEDAKKSADFENDYDDPDVPTFGTGVVNEYKKDAAGTSGYSVIVMA